MKNYRGFLQILHFDEVKMFGQVHHSQFHPSEDAAPEGAEGAEGGGAEGAESFSPKLCL